MLRISRGAMIVASVLLATAPDGAAQTQRPGAPKAAEKPSRATPAAPKAAEKASRETPAARIQRLEADLADLATQNFVLKDRVNELEAEIAALRRQPAPNAPPVAVRPPNVIVVTPAPTQPLDTKPADTRPVDGKPVDVRPIPPDTKPLVTDIDALLRAACGLRLQPDSGAPGAKDLIIVSAQRRASIEEALRANGAPAVDIEAPNVEACFSPLGGDYVVVVPPDKRDLIVSVVGGDGSALSEWLVRSAAGGTRVRLAPSAECRSLLEQVTSRAGPASAVWVEQDKEPSRCERDSDGSANVDPNKIEGYGGVIVLKVQRG
jgi:hypothetical protein